MRKRLQGPYRAPPNAARSLRPWLSWSDLHPISAVVLFVAIVTFLVVQTVRNWVAPEPLKAESNAQLLPDERRTVDMFKMAAPSVVHITTLDIGRVSLLRNLAAIPRGSGSGFVWDEKGHIVTNYHVVRDHDVARITFADQSGCRATVIGYAADEDLAVLELDALHEAVPPIAIGTSSNLAVGQSVLAIGDPFGLDHTLSKGVIRGLGREIKSGTGLPIAGAIQTDATINPGNSGGPLLDSAGAVIGMNTGITSASAASAAIGFAIPVHHLRRYVPSSSSTAGSGERARRGRRRHAHQVQTPALTLWPSVGVSHPDCGTLPRARCHEAAVLPSFTLVRLVLRNQRVVSVEHSTGDRAMRLLVAEDDANLRALIVATLRRTGHTVTECATGAELLDALAPLLEHARVPYDLIVSDVRMPGLTGMSILAGVGSNARCPPFILMTAFGDAETHATASQLGAVALLDKPFELDALCKHVSAALRRSEER